MPYVIEYIAECKEGENSITNRQIRQRLFDEQGIVIAGSDVRTIIHYVQINGLLKGLVSSRKGYCVTRDINRVCDYVESLMERSDSILSVALAVKKQFGLR